MSTPIDAGFDFAIPIDRWAVRLDEPSRAGSVADASGSVPVAHTPGTEAEAIPFPMEVPSEGFEPRLLRFGEAA